MRGFVDAPPGTVEQNIKEGLKIMKKPCNVVIKATPGGEGTH